MYEFYMLGFIRKHTIPFKNYKSKDLMPELEKYLNEIEGWNRSSGNIRKCMMFGSEKFRKFMLQIIEEFLLERLLFWRDYKAATGLMLEYPCERLCAPVIVQFYRHMREDKLSLIKPADRCDYAKKFGKIFSKRMKRIENMEWGVINFKQRPELIGSEVTRRLSEVLFGNSNNARKRLNEIMLGIKSSIEKLSKDPYYFYFYFFNDYLDCNYWKPSPVSEEEGRKILEEIE